MIKITIIALGKLKEKYLKDAVEEYKKRLTRYCKLEIAEIEPVKLPEKPTQTEIDSALDREAAEIFKRIPSGSEIFSLCIEGNEMPSVAFARTVSERLDMGKNISFIIGSSYGLSQKVKDKSHVRLSMSQMTFPHQLFRVMLLEQIYRAFKIDEGSAYHK